MYSGKFMDCGRACVRVRFFEKGRKRGRVYRISSKLEMLAQARQVIVDGILLLVFPSLSKVR